MAQIRAAERLKILGELKQLADDVARCQRTIDSVMAEFKSANSKYAGQRTTRQDVEYLTVLLDCAKKKLAWEKQIASVHKRAPELLERMMRVINDEEHPPTDEVKTEMLRSLQILQRSLEGLQMPDSPQ